MGSLQELQAIFVNETNSELPTTPGGNKKRSRVKEFLEETIVTTGIFQVSIINKNCLW